MVYLPSADVVKNCYEVCRCRSRISSGIQVSFSRRSFDLFIKGLRFTGHIQGTQPLRGDRASVRKSRRLRGATGFDVAHRWLTEEPFVLAAELAGAFITDFESRTRRIHSLDKHSFSRCN